MYKLTILEIKLCMDSSPVILRTQPVPLASSIFKILLAGGIRSHKTESIAIE